MTLPMIDEDSWPYELMKLMRTRGGEALDGGYQLFTVEHAKLIHDAFVTAAKSVGGLEVRLVCNEKVWARHANADWYPFASKSGDEYLVIDRSPGPRGFSGQVVFVWQEDSRFKWLDQSFASFAGKRGLLKNLAPQLQDGIEDTQRMESRTPRKREIHDGVGHPAGLGHPARFS